VVESEPAVSRWRRHPDAASLMAAAATGLVFLVSTDLAGSVGLAGSFSLAHTSTALRVWCAWWRQFATELWPHEKHIEPKWILLSSRLTLPPVSVLLELPRLLC
jgi:hypothetical protein